MLLDRIWCRNAARWLYVDRVVFLWVAQRNRCAPGERARCAIDIDEQCVGSQPKIARRSARDGGDPSSWANVFDDSSEPWNVGMEVVQDNRCRFRKLVELLIGRCGVEVPGVEIRRQQAFVPFRVIPSCRPFLHVRRTRGPMRSDRAKADGRDQMVRVLNDEPTRQQIRNRGLLRGIDARSDGHTERIPRRGTPRRSFPAQRHAGKWRGFWTGTIRIPRAITGHENRLVHAADGQTNEQRGYRSTLRCICVTDEENVDITLERDEVRRHANALGVTVPEKIRRGRCVWRNQRCGLVRLQEKRRFTDDRIHVRVWSRSPKQRANCNRGSRREPHGSKISLKDSQVEGRIWDVHAVDR